MGRIISTIMFIVLLLVSCFSATTFAGLIAHWKLDETSGTIAHDSIGSYNGTLSSTGATWVTGGMVGGALNLTATEKGLVNMGTVLNNLSGTSFSIVAWVKTNIANENNQMVVACHKAENPSGYILGVNSSAGGQYGETKKAWFYNIYPGTTPKSTTIVVDDKWHQMAGVKDKSTGLVYLYVDGKLEGYYSDQGIGNAPAGTPLLFGGCLGSDGTTLLSLYTGLLDDIQFYDAALTGSQIKYLYYNPGAVVPLPGSLLLLGTGLLGLGALGFRRRLRS